MFEEDNDDFSFLDEEFLNDALQPTTSRKSPSKHRELLKDIQEKTIEDVDKIPSLSKVLNISNKRLKSHENENDKSIVKKQKTDKAVLNSNFELDDFFDSIDSDNDISIESQQNTPPDSEFANISQQQLDDLVQCEEKNNGTSSSTIDFREKILQSLHAHKQLSETKYNGSFAKPCLSRNDELRRASTSGIENRKRMSPDDSSSKSFNFATKRKLTSLASESKAIFSEKNIADDSFFFTPLKSGQASVRKSVSPGGPVIQKRKFPGPAGLLPELGFRTAPVNVQPLSEKNDSPPDSKDIVCSQSSADEFLCGPWQQMSKDLVHCQINQASPLTVFNIKWVLRRAGLRGHAGVRKIPFLAVMVRSIDISLSDATVLLKDKTGEMSGTIANSVLEEYAEAITAGCVLLLKDVILLSPVSLKSAIGGGEPIRRHYLNITLNTIHTIYSSEESGGVVTTAISAVDIKELLQQASTLKVASTPRAIVEEEEEEEMIEEHPEQKQLFSYVSNNCNSPLPLNRENINYRGTTPYMNTSASGSFQQKQKFVFNSPLNNSPRPVSHLGHGARPGSVDYRAKFSPTSSIVNQSSMALNASGITRPQRFSSPFQATTSSFSSPSCPKMSGPVTQPTKVVSSSQMSNNVFRSQQEENEVNDLLENIDEDSLFGDF
ncbi:uncharacterized protein [Palaemon carinicauda]|uniref:uncharacterized protein isoform X2 n=1 Tax=Palaemon carinicauda TaxID=392227 RepID=UPI0035B5DDBB